MKQREQDQDNGNSFQVKEVNQLQWNKEHESHIYSMKRNSMFELF